MGSPDLISETPQGTVYLDLKTVVINCETRKLRVRKSFFTRLPRKIKKKLKKFHGENYNNWLNSPIEWVPELNSDIHCYHSIDAEEELTKLLIDEINKKS